MDRDVHPRVKAFCDWLNTLPAGARFDQLPQFRFFSDLTDAQISAARHEMRRRAADALAEAAKLDAERKRHRCPDHAGIVETTREQDLMIEIAIRDAISVCPNDVTAAAELLMGAAFSVLLRNFSPASALKIFDAIAEAGREAINEVTQ